MCPIENFINENVSAETKLVLAKKFSNLFYPTAPFDNDTCIFMYKENQHQFNAYVFGYVQDRETNFINNLVPSASFVTKEETRFERAVKMNLNLLEKRIEVLEKNCNIQKSD